MRPASLILLPLAMLPAAPALAQAPLRDLCGDRPGLGTSTCIVDAGRLQVETGVSWSRSEAGDFREDEFAIGETLLRYGLDERTEVQVGLPGLGVLETREAGASESETGFGDVTVALRRNLLSPDGSGTSLSVQAFVSLPTDDDVFGAGDWGAGLLVPASFELGEIVSLALTGQVEAAVDADGEGRHVAYGGVLGLGVAVAEGFDLSLEIGLTRDDDPDEASTEALAAASMAWQAGESLQFDAGIAFGLNRDSPDLILSAGLVRRF